MTAISNNRSCDNFDHTGPHTDLQAVTLREEYGGGVVDWCDACRERDVDMIVPECGNCGRPIADVDETTLISETVNRCSRCLYLDREEL
jgi:hypothetical protein